MSNADRPGWTDPAPPGDSFSSGAPDFDAPTGSETMTVVSD